jgi:hypothetical protein
MEGYRIIENNPMEKVSYKKGEVLLLNSRI